MFFRTEQAQDNARIYYVLRFRKSRETNYVPVSWFTLYDGEAAILDFNDSGTQVARYLQGPMEKPGT